MTHLHRCIFTAAFAATTFISAAACAHAKLQISIPAAGATLGAAPKEVTLQFNEKLETAFSSVKVTDSAGHDVGTAKPHLDPARPTFLTLELPALKPGTYGVHWAVVGQDGHRLKGEYSFTLK